MKRWIVFIALWFVGIALVFAGMLAHYYGWTMPQWAPAWLINDPVVCLIWSGIIVNAIQTMWIVNTDKEL